MPLHVEDATLGVTREPQETRPLLSGDRFAVPTAFALLRLHHRVQRLLHPLAHVVALAPLALEHLEHLRVDVHLGNGNKKI